MTAPRIPKSITITDDRLWIDGADFPFYIAQPGPVLSDDGMIEGRMTVEILYYTDETIVTDLRTAG